MLGKLIKYEWKSTYKVGLILLAATAMATLIGFLSLQTPLWRSIANDRVYYDSFAGNMLDIMSFFSIMLYIILLVGVYYGTLIYLVVRFYRSMYTDEGYLLHTLPVTKNQILFSKIFIGSVWVYIICLAMIASLMIFAFSLVGVFVSDSLWEILTEVYESMREFMYNMNRIFDINAVSWFFSMVVTAIIKVPASLIILFGAVSIGQLFSKHRVLMAIVSYIAIAIVNYMLNAILQGIALLVSANSQSLNEFSFYMSGSSSISLVTSVVLAVGCYLASYFITSRKLNMD